MYLGIEYISEYFSISSCILREVGEFLIPLDLPISIQGSKLDSVVELRLDTDDRITKQEITVIENKKIVRKFITIGIHCLMMCVDPKHFWRII
jgi:hypothetical protein